jgi:hypothetical protein
VTPLIRAVAVVPVRVTDAEVVLDVCVELAEAGCEVRGTLVGPKRAAAATVEVAHPLRVTVTSDAAVTLRAVIPEPTPGTAADPVRYAGTVEAWRAGAMVEARPFAVVFRGA